MLQKCLKLVALCWLAAEMAVAGTIQLQQHGWTYGGPLTVTFHGTDVNLDGEIAQIELTAFIGVYVLPGGGSTEWTLPDLEPDGFLFSDTRNFLFVASNSSYTLIDSALAGVAAGSVVNQFLFPIDVTDATLTAIPEPAGLAVIGLGLVAGLRKIFGRHGRLPER